MFEPAGVAAACGLTVEIADLGDWSGLRLISEYDAAARTVRINARALEAFRRACAPEAADLAALCKFAIAHELFHHFDTAGTRPRPTRRDRREAAADAYARANVPIDERLAAFLACVPAPSIGA